LIAFDAHGNQLQNGGDTVSLSLLPSDPGSDLRVEDSGTEMTFLVSPLSFPSSDWMRK